MRKLRRALGNIWDLSRQVLSVRGLLDWIGWKQPVVAAIMAIAAGLWAFLQRIPLPIVALIVMAFGPIVIIAWRALTMHPPPGRQESAPVDVSSDQKTIAALKKLLPNEGGIAEIRNQPFWGKFPWPVDSLLISFLQGNTGPENGFLDEHLEQLRRQLQEAIEVLLDRVRRYSDPPDLPLYASDTEGAGYRYFWKRDGEDIASYDARRNEVFEAAKAVCNAYDDLILTARRKFES